MKMTSKDIVERYFINEKADIIETAETCYRMCCHYPVEEKIEEAREKYEQVKSDLDRLEKLKKVLKEIKDNVICPYFQDCESQCEDILKIINEVLEDGRD